MRPSAVLTDKRLQGLSPQLRCRRVPDPEVGDVSRNLARQPNGRERTFEGTRG